MSNQNPDFSKKTFRELMGDFEATTAKFDEIELDIEQAMELHKKASQLLDELERRLKAAEASLKTES